MTEHTPGPWHPLWQASVEDYEIRTEPTSQNGQLIATVYLQREQTEANARLIAAAPETAAERDRLKEINADLLVALERSKQLFDEALDKFNWGASALDANAVRLLNEVPIEVNAALAKAREHAKAGEG